MRLHFMSDLHLERQDYDAPAPPGGDVLALLGDVCEVATLLERRAGSERAAARDRAFWFLDAACERYAHVLYVMGNHEALEMRPLEARAELERLTPPNLRVLENDTVEIGGARFFGATFWSDLSDPAAAAAAGETMPEYRYGLGPRGAALTPADTTAAHRASRAALAAAAALAPGRPLAALTHHAPAAAALDAWRAAPRLDPAFAAAAEDLMARPEIAVWLYGHTHCNAGFDVAGCAARSNCYGYPGQRRARGAFDPAAALEWDGAAWRAEPARAGGVRAA